MKPKIDFITLAVTDLPKEEPWGYTANFADPDGHQWEIAHVPHE